MYCKSSFLPEQSPPEMPTTKVLQFSMGKLAMMVLSFLRWMSFLVVLTDFGVALYSSTLTCFSIFIGIDWENINMTTDHIGAYLLS